MEEASTRNQKMTETGRKRNLGRNSTLRPEGSDQLYILNPYLNLSL